MGETKSVYRRVIVQNRIYWYILIHFIYWTIEMNMKSPAAIWYVRKYEEWSVLWIEFNVLHRAYIKQPQQKNPTIPFFTLRIVDLFHFINFSIANYVANEISFSLYWICLRAKIVKFYARYAMLATLLCSWTIPHFYGSNFY